MSQVLMLYLGSLIFRTLCIAAIAGIFTRWVRNVAVRHAIWVTVLIAMLAMPFADAILPPSWIPTPVERITVEQLQILQVVVVESVSQPAILHSVTPPAVPKHVHDWWGIAALLYAFVGLGLLVRLGLAYRRIAQLSRESRPVASGLRDDVAAAHGLRWRIPELRESAAVRVPITVGFLRPLVILPADWNAWDEWKLRAVLSHEFAHIRRADWAIAAVAAFNKCVFWMNPLSIFIERHLSELAEQASDDAAVHLTSDSTRYAEVLLQFAAAHNGHRILRGGVAMARHKMQARIERVLTIRRSGSGVLKLAGWTLVLTLAMPVLYAAAAIQVASGTAPAPNYAELVAQLPLPSVPGLPKQPPTLVHAPLQLAQQQITETEKQSAAVPQTASPSASPNFEIRGFIFQGTSASLPGSVTFQRSAPDSAALSSLPKIVTKVNPTYPGAAWMGNIEGSVHLTLTIGQDGHVSKVDVLSSTNPVFTSGAVESMQQWVFEPQQVDGTPASITRDIILTFSLLPPPTDVRISYSLSYPAANEILVQVSPYPAEALPGSPDILLIYLRELASLRSTDGISANLSVLNPAAPSDPFSFALKNVESGSYAIQIEDRKTSYECHGMSNCSFLLASNGASRVSGTAAASRFGLLVEPYVGTKRDQLELTCQAQACTLTTIENGKAITRKLKKGESATISDSAKISGMVN